jgi:hypothetical protein
MPAIFALIAYVMPAFYKKPHVRLVACTGLSARRGDNVRANDYNGSAFGTGM